MAGLARDHAAVDLDVALDDGLHWGTRSRQAVPVDLDPAMEGGSCGRGIRRACRVGRARETGASGHDQRRTEGPCNERPTWRREARATDHALARPCTTVQRRAQRAIKARSRAAFIDRGWNRGLRTQSSRFADTVASRRLHRQEAGASCTIARSQAVVFESRYGKAHGGRGRIGPADAGVAGGLPRLRRGRSKPRRRWSAR